MTRPGPLPVSCSRLAATTGVVVDPVLLSTTTLKSVGGGGFGGARPVFRQSNNGSSVGLGTTSSMAAEEVLVVALALLEKTPFCSQRSEEEGARAGEDAGIFPPSLHDGAESLDEDVDGVLQDGEDVDGVLLVSTEMLHELVFAEKLPAAAAGRSSLLPLPEEDVVEHIEAVVEISETSAESLAGLGAADPRTSTDLDRRRTRTSDVAKESVGVLVVLPAVRVPPAGRRMLSAPGAPPPPPPPGATPSSWSRKEEAAHGGAPRAFCSWMQPLPRRGQTAAVPSTDATTNSSKGTEGCCCSSSDGPTTRIPPPVFTSMLPLVAARRTRVGSDVLLADASCCVENTSASPRYRKHLSFGNSLLRLSLSEGSSIFFSPEFSCFQIASTESSLPLYKLCRSRSRAAADGTWNIVSPR